MPLALSITHLVAGHGIYAVFVLMVIAAVVPAASELTMIYAGAVAAGVFSGEHVTLFGHRFGSGASAFVAMALAGVAGNEVGAAIGWWIGVVGGRPLLERYGRPLHVGPARLARAERWFDRFELAAVPLGFATPIVRSFVAIPAGIFRVPFARFLALAVVGITVFSFALAGAGWAVGRSYSHVHGAFRYVDAVVVVGVALLAAYFFVRRRRSSTMANRA